jgi:hypothetical protein
MFCMTEHEKDQQIGKLAEEYSDARGKLNHVTEKLARFQSACQIIVNPQSFQSLRVEEGKLVFNKPPTQPTGNLDGLLDHSQLKEVIEEKQRLAGEVQRLRQRLVGLTPHLF